VEGVGVTVDAASYEEVTEEEEEEVSMEPGVERALLGIPLLLEGSKYSLRSDRIRGVPGVPGGNPVIGECVGGEYPRSDGGADESSNSS
jgi:hypothetical protein